MQGENERQWKKKVKKKTYDISSIKRVTKKFLEVSRCSRAKQRQRNVQEKCAARTLASHAGVFRGARFSSLSKNACSTEDNIPFPSLANHFVLSEFWEVDLDRKVIWWLLDLH